MGELISEGAFGVLPPGNSYVKEGGIRFLRATELQNDNRIDWSACLRAPIEFARHERAQLKIGDILIAVKGATIASEKSICTVASLDEQTIINGSIFRFQPTDETTSAFLREVLSSNFIKQQMKASLILNNAVDYLSRTSLDSLALPLPAIQTQRLLVVKMEAARATRKQKLAEADGLLAGVDDFVLQQLGLTVPQEEKLLAFAVRLGEMLPARVDSHFYKPYLRKTEEAIVGLPFQKVALHTLLDSAPINGIDAREYLATGQRYLRVQNVRPYELLLSDVKYVASESTKDVSLKSGDVLLTRKGTFGVATTVSSEAEDCLISSEIILLRLRQSVRCLPDYLVAWLNNSMAQRLLERYKTGGIMGHITQDVVSEFPVPLPPLPIQQAIANEITRCREQARRLRDDANTGWQAAKTRFEAQLLGDY